MPPKHLPQNLQKCGHIRDLPNPAGLRMVTLRPLEAESLSGHVGSGLDHLNSPGGRWPCKFPPNVTIPPTKIGRGVS